MQRAILAAAVFVSALTAMVGCSSSSSTAPPATAPPTEPTTTEAPAVSSLAVSGLSPGVEQAPFYPSTTVKAVGCGPVPGGVWVGFILPPSPSAPAGNAFTEATLVLVVNGRAELKDAHGKLLYQLVLPSIKTSRQGSFVLSLESDTYISGDQKSVPQGAVDVTGDYTCPARDRPFPGL